MRGWCGWFWSGCDARGAHAEGCVTAHVKRFRGGLVFKPHRLLYHSTLGLRVIKKKNKSLHTSALVWGAT